MAWQQPKILGSLVEVSEDDKSPFIDIVDNLTDHECENVKDSVMIKGDIMERHGGGEPKLVQTRSDNKQTNNGVKTTPIVNKSPLVDEDAPAQETAMSGKAILDNEEDRGVVKQIRSHNSVKTVSNASKSNTSTSEDSSSDSDSSHDKVTASLAASEAVGKQNESISRGNDSATDSSNKSTISVEKFEHAVTGMVTDPPSEAEALSQTINLSSSGERDLDDEKPIRKRKTSVVDKSPHLSSKVLTGAAKVRERAMAPDGISPILKTRVKKASLGKNSGVPYFDLVMARIKSQKSEDAKPGQSDSSDINRNYKPKKKVKKVERFL